MDYLLKLISGISIFIIFWAMLGYPLTIRLIDKILKPKDNKKVDNSDLTVTVMVVAHNEEKVIQQKLENIINLEYPSTKIKFIIASDNSTDNTNNIVQKFIEDNPKYNITLFKATKRMGKTNAQNEAQKFVDSDILVMTDANSMLLENSVQEIVNSFSSENIAYVTGKLIYSNSKNNFTSESEATYWDTELETRYIESKLQTITAGNGALYAVRNEEYVDFDPINSHDSIMPMYYALNGKRAVFNKDAIAIEKAGETNSDEFGRKVRMNRVLLKFILPSISLLNILKYRWYTFFYLGHRTSRYLLWVSHIFLFICSLILSSNNILYFFLLLLQILFYLLALVQQFFKSKSKLLILINYYTLTLVAQIVGVYKVVTGKAKPFWEKAETTR